jgi:hypothetical protein
MLPLGFVIKFELAGMFALNGPFVGVYGTTAELLAEFALTTSVFISFD